MCKWSELWNNTCCSAHARTHRDKEILHRNWALINAPFSIYTVIPHPYSGFFFIPYLVREEFVCVAPPGLCANQSGIFTGKGTFPGEIFFPLLPLGVPWPFMHVGWEPSSSLFPNSDLTGGLEELRAVSQLLFGLSVMISAEDAEVLNWWTRKPLPKATPRVPRDLFRSSRVTKSGGDEQARS